MQLNFVAQQRLLSPTELERLCLRRSIDINRVANLCGHTILPGQAPSLDLATGIAILIFLQAEEAGFEPNVVRAWVPHLRNETLFRLAEHLENWACPAPSKEWEAYVPLLWGARESTRRHIVRLLPRYSSADTAWKVRFFSGCDVEMLKDDSDSWPTSGRTPRLVIDADDLAQRIMAVCSGPLFTVRSRGSLAA